MVTLIGLVLIVAGELGLCYRSFTYNEEAHQAHAGPLNFPVKDHEPVGEAKEFDASVGQVSCWTRVIAATVPTTIKHVWYFDNQKVYEISLDIKYPRTRTWSTKTIRAGNWRVDVTDETGNVLTSVSFTVK